MGPVVINIDPVIVQLGHFSLRWYGLAVAAAIIAALLLTLREAKRKGIPKDEIYAMAMWAIPSGVVGARLLHVIDKWDYYGANPEAIFAIQNGGLAILGAILGGAVACIIYVRRRGLSLGQVGDAVAPGLLLGQAIGRIGCIINGDALGAPTSMPWGLTYTNPGAMAPSLGQAYHPTPVYEMAWDLLALGLLWWARRHIKIDGLLFLTYLSLYSVGKFVISFWRQEQSFLLGLQEAQAISLATLIVSAIWGTSLLWRSRQLRLDPTRL